MKKNIGTIGHVDHGKTTLSHAIAVAHTCADRSIVITNSTEITKHDNENVQQLLNVLREDVIESVNIADGKSKRRQRRKKQRKNNFK